MVEIVWQYSPEWQREMRIFQRSSGESSPRALPTQQRSQQPAPPRASDVLERLNRVQAALGECVVFSLTDTMLRKGIIDAIEPFRNLLKRTGVHDFERQEQGPDHKVTLQARLLVSGTITEGVASAYRPVTKQGDPRIWVYGLGSQCEAGDQIAITVGASGELLVVLLTSADWTGTQLALEGKFSEFALGPRHATESPYLDELVRRLRAIALGPALPGLLAADTSVGRTLEEALDIRMNSSRDPDYHGIELKFKRQRPPALLSRSTLFGQVADWSISHCKSSAEILDAFGYTREGVFKLNTEVGARPNSLGLFLRHDPAHDLLEECSTRPDMPSVAKWRLATLRQRLTEKHSETAWVEVETKDVEGVEHFRPVRLLYTSAPRVDVFPLLVDSGLVTMDHLIKRTGTSVTERGPLWKLESNGHSALFAGSREIPLTNSPSPVG